VVKYSLIMKILLVQLPVPNNRLSNLPLALGYLKASADAAHIPDLEVEILAREVQDRGGDAFLLAAILAHDPDMVGFSLYTWNSARALNLAHALKKAAPEILTLAGGPEVNRDGDFVLSAGKALDFLVRGEGEGTFVELLKSLNGRKGSGQGRVPQQLELELSKIYGLAYHPAAGLEAIAQEWVFNPPRPAIEDVNLLPSVYLSGALEGFLGRFMMIELSRWCPSKCTFCYYGRQDLPLGGKRYFETKRVRQELLFGLAHGVEQVHFVEANFNTLPHLNQLYATIKETGANRRIRFYAEMRGEAIDEAEADKLADCNFGIVECGLQSAVPEVLARVRRKNNLPRLVRGVHLLRERGIEVFLDAILGLPGDTLETFWQSLAFIGEQDLAPFDLFHLQILPGTQLKAEASAGQHGIEWQAAPPYFALQTAQLTFEQLCQLRHETLLGKGDDPAEIQGLPLPGPFSLVTSPKSQVQSARLMLQKPIERLVLRRAGLEDEAGLRGVAQRLASEVTLWLRLAKIDEAGLTIAQKALTLLSEPNLSSSWHIFVEGERPLTQRERRQLTQAVRHEASYLDGLAVFALAERDPARFAEWPSVGLYELAPWSSDFVDLVGPKAIWQLELTHEETVEQWRRQLEAVTQAPGYGLHLAFPRNVAISKVREVLDYFEPAGKTLFLKDLELAAGLVAAQSEDATVPIFPLTLELEGGSNHLLQPAPAELERAALGWARAHH